jgi:D-glycero-alpha-D-manno-heptose-7-phosphate kinase
VIITRTPLRVSFAGGGTDLASFYREYGGGAVVSAAIDKYIHVLVNEKFDSSIRVAYSKTENVERVEQLQHELVREAMRLTGVTGAIEIHSIADIPGEGSGLGSSSTFTVGLLNALYHYRGTLRDARELAEEAARIEIDILKGTLGKQDHYAAAYGGLHYFEFRPDDSVRVVPIPLSRAEMETFEQHLTLFYTGITRSAQGLLRQQDSRTTENKDRLLRLRGLATETRDALLARDWAKFGAILDEGWQLKRGLAAGVSNDAIDEVYRRVRAAGAYGGKILGAGGGGFLLVAHPPEGSAQVAAAVPNWRRFPVRVSLQGTQALVVFR